MKRLATGDISGRFFWVWFRNLVVYRKIWQLVFLPPLLEPLFYLAAFGIGLSALVGSVVYQGLEVSYIRFLAPALLSINIMYNAFFETTYSSFVRMYYQKTYDAMLATPLSLTEIITGEMVWAATKAILATVIMQGVISLFGLIVYPHSLLIIPLAFLGGLAFATIGMFFTALMKTIEMFNLPIFLFITPMFLFSGTFFPLDTLPAWAQNLAYAFPLWHLVRLVRAFCFGTLSLPLLWSVAYLAVFAGLFFVLGTYRMRRRLIK